VWIRGAEEGLGKLDGDSCVPGVVGWTRYVSYLLNEVRLNVIDFQTDGIQMAFSVLGDGLICERCCVCLDVRVKDVLVQWSSAKVSGIYLLQDSGYSLILLRYVRGQFSFVLDA
jgi:hypothetical protein